MARKIWSMFGPLLAGLFVSSLAIAQECTLWRLNGAGIGLPNLEGVDKLALCQQMSELDTPADGFLGRIWRTVDVRIENGNCMYTRQSSLNGGQTWSNDAWRNLSYTNRGPTECPPEECTDNSSQYSKSFSDGWPGPASYCDTATNCVVERVFAAGSNGAGRGWALYQATGRSCSGSEGTYDGDGDDDVECAVIRGHTLCNRPGERNCGTINGEYVCLGDNFGGPGPNDPPPEGGCDSLSGGGKLCDPDADAPPAPDTGVPGRKAEPDLTVETEGSSGPGRAWEYFDSSTVGRSTGVEPGEGGEPGCDPAEDSGCVNVGKDWVDREYTPPGVPTFPTDGLEGLDSVGGKWADTEGENAGHVSSFKTFLQGTFPFSLFASPLTMFGGTAQPPEVELTLRGHTASAPVPFEQLFAAIRAVTGVLLLFGFYLLLMQTVREWST